MSYPTNPFARRGKASQQSPASKALTFCRDLPTIPDTVTAGELVEALQRMVDRYEGVYDEVEPNGDRYQSARAYAAEKEAGRILAAFKDKSNG